MKSLIFLFTLLITVIISCSSDEDYSQLQDWRSELRTEIMEARRNVNSTSNLAIRSEIYIDELELKAEHSGNHATFLNLDISVVDGRFIYKLFDNATNFHFFIIRMPPHGFQYS